MYFANWASSMAGKKKSTEARPVSRGGPKRGKKKIDFWTIETKKNEDDGYVLEKMRFVEKENEERGEWVGLGRPANARQKREKVGPISAAISRHCNCMHVRGPQSVNVHMGYDFAPYIRGQVREDDT
jgi:hypothetical protein